MEAKIMEGIKIFVERTYQLVLDEEFKSNLLSDIHIILVDTDNSQKKFPFLEKLRYALDNAQ
jgi:hypothetical protein